MLSSMQLQFFCSLNRPLLPQQPEVNEARKVVPWPACQPAPRPRFRCALIVNITSLVTSVQVYRLEIASTFVMTRSTAAKYL